jgi:cytochrome c oxidase subunit II
VNKTFFMRIFFAAVLAVLSLTFSASAASAGDTPAPLKIEVVAKRFAYIPAEITLKKDVPVVIELTSLDVPHGVKFKELNIGVDDIKKDGKAELAFTPTQVGDFVGHCSRFCGAGHGSMILTLHVRE